MNKLLLIVILVSIIGVPLAYGHPFTGETKPAEFSNVPTGTSEVIVFYSEGVEIDFSGLKVFDTNGDQIDNKDSRYYEGDYSLIVSTPPLEDGVYTVTSKVLSKVDGHLVDDAFIFAVGDVKIDPKLAQSTEPTELIFFPEAGARFPGLLGQTIILGAVIASVFLWATQRKDLIKEELNKVQAFHHGKFMSVIGFGLIIVFASNILMLTIQIFRLETSAFDVLQTNFGMTWIIRMGITISLLGVWFGMERMKRLSIKNQIPLLVMSLALIATTTMMGHGAASEQAPAIAIDYIHNLVTATWIGGIIYLAFALLPSFSSLDENKREKMSLVTIPRFSIMIVIAIGIVIISGPTLLWFLETNVVVITESTYGKLIIAKILIAAAMIGIGTYHQFGIQKRAESNLKSGPISVHKKFKRALKAEIGLGVLLLAVVALLTNGTLPAGEIQTVDAQEGFSGYSTTEFSEQIIFDVSLNPFSSGTNNLKVSVTDLNQNPINDLRGLKVKVSNPQKNIAPIKIPMELESESMIDFKGEVTFGFSGQWQLEIEAQRTQNANEGITLLPLIKPTLDNLKAEIVEYDLPEFAAPLYPVYDGQGNIWISDTSAPRIWKFSIADEEFTKYEIDGQITVSLKMDSKGNIWFTDVPSGQIGYLDTKTDQVEIIEIPNIVPLTQKAIPMLIEEDSDGNIWVSISNKNALLKYNKETKEFEEFKLPSKESIPFAVALAPDGKIWFTQQKQGQIGYVNTQTDEIREIKPSIPLLTPETITFDSEGNLWISEHQEGGAITKYNPFLQTFNRIPVIDPAAFPNSAVFDKYQNVWFAQHTVDKLAVYDPLRGDLIEIPIQNEQSWVQFTVADGDNNVWFVQQKPNKLAMVKLTELPSVGIIQEEGPQISLRYSEIVSPLISAGIIATSLFFVKSVQDKRRINQLIED